jgi:cyclophilin family peptidyl-prolyl cis-trans isomerase
MSDVSQGPGWWQASDGKWHPLEATPQYPTPSETADQTPAVDSGQAMPNPESGTSIPTVSSVCTNGHGLRDVDQFCTVCGSPRSQVPVDTRPLSPPPAPSPGPHPYAPPSAPGQVPPPFIPPGQYPPINPGYAGSAPPFTRPGPQTAWVPGGSVQPANTTNDLAIASMVLGILWVFWIGSILALVFGLVALKQIKVRNETGRGMAIAGVVLGIVGTVSILVIFIIGFVQGVTSLSSGDTQAAVDAAAVKAGCPSDPTAPLAKQTWPNPPMLSVEPSSSYKTTVTTDVGSFTIALDAKDAPLTVNNFVFLAANGFFDCISFHRVIPGFVDQTGDPSGTGTGGPGYKYQDENIPNSYAAGNVAMANAGPNTNGSQFFIVVPGGAADLNAHLASQGYSLFGKVTSGMSVVEEINRDGSSSGKPTIKHRILSVKVLRGSSGANGAAGGGSSTTSTSTTKPSPTSGGGTSGGGTSGGSAKPTEPGGGGGAPAPGGGTGGGNGAGNCFGCVTINTLTVAAWAVPGSGVDQDCLPTPFSRRIAEQKIGPNVQDPNRTFVDGFTIQIATGITQSGTDCSAMSYNVTVRVATGKPTVEIQSVNPPVPFDMEAGQAVQITLTFHVPNGNNYNGDLGIDVYVG